MLQEPVKLHKKRTIRPSLLTSTISWRPCYSWAIISFPPSNLISSGSKLQIIELQYLIEFDISVLFLLAEWQNRISSVNYKNYCFV